MSRVLPGVPETFASPCRPVSMLMSDDLPTLLRPMKAMSFSESFGTCEMRSELHLNSALWICMVLEFCAKIAIFPDTAREGARRSLLAAPRFVYPPRAARYFPGCLPRSQASVTHSGQ